MRVEDTVVKFPDEFYVGFNMRYEVANEPHVKLGFATPTEYAKTDGKPTMAFTKRKATVDGWSHYNVSADGVVSSLDKVEYDANTRQHNKIKGKILDESDPTYPIYMKNELVEGFKIQATKTRWGGWFSNKSSVWRVLDPRGFELEIYAANLAFILDGVGVLPNGVIPGKCVWGRDTSGKNVLVPESSSVYSISHQVADKIAAQTFVQLKDITRGSLVQFQEEECFYWGSTNIISANNSYRKKATEIKTANRYLLERKTGELFFVSSPKIEKVISPSSIVVSAEMVAIKINEYIRNLGERFNDTLNGVVLYASASKTEIAKAKVKQELIEYPGTLQIVGELDSYSYGGKKIHLNGEVWLSSWRNIILLKDSKAFKLRNFDYRIITKVPRAWTITDWNNIDEYVEPFHEMGLSTLNTINNDIWQAFDSYDGYNNTPKVRIPVNGENKGKIPSEFTAAKLAIVVELDGIEVSRVFPLETKND